MGKIMYAASTQVEIYRPVGRAAWALRDARALRAGVADPDFALDERRERRVDDALVGVLTVFIARSSEKDYSVAFPNNQARK